ncbi:MAG: YidC/Oxa1 family membrane protein insertase [Bacillota bacterium]
MQGDFFLTTWFFEGMKWVYYNIAGSHIVITIVICTILLKLITVFSDIKSRQYSMKMAVVQPEIQRIQKKYKDNPKKAQEEQSKLMKREGVSMLGGCLPMLVMMPLFFCFIAAFRFWGHEQMVRVLLELSETGHSTLFDSFRFLWVANIWQPDNGTVSVVMNAQTFLANAEIPKLLFFQQNPAALEAFKNLGFIIADPQNIPAEAIAKYNELVAPLIAQYQGYSNGWFILPVLSAGVNFLSQWILSKSQPATPNNNSKMMLYLFPAMSFFFCLSANAAFAVYWVMSGLTTLATQLILNKKFPRPVVEVEK